MPAAAKEKQTQPQEPDDHAREAAAPATREARGAAAVADTLFGKIAEVQAAVGVMPKDRHVDVKKNGQLQYSYDYLSESTLMLALRTELTRRGVATFVSVDSQTREGQLTAVEISVTFADAATGATFTVKGQGQGADLSDKGVYKATTGAVRYVLWKTFLVPTEGDDPNQPHEVDAQSSDAPVTMTDALARMNAFVEDGRPWIKEAAEGFYPSLDGGFPANANALPNQVRVNLIRRLQRVVLELESEPNYDPLKVTDERAQELVRRGFAKAFDGLGVIGPDPFKKPIPF